MSGLIDKYAWADADNILLAAAVIRPAHWAAVLDVYGASAQSALGDLTFTESIDVCLALGSNSRPLQLLNSFDDTEPITVAIEPGGWSSSLIGLAIACSTPASHFFSVYCNSESLYQIVDARNGVVNAHFDPLYVEDGGLPDDMLPEWATPEGFPVERLRAAIFASMEQRTGVAFEPEWLEAKLPTYTIPDPFTLYDR